MPVHAYSPEKTPLDDKVEHRQVEFVRVFRYQDVIVDSVELLPAVVSAWIMSASMSQQSREVDPPDAVMISLRSAQPSRWTLLVSCMTFGCSAASFVQRRQHKNPTQIYIFAACVAASAVVGQHVEASIDYIVIVHVSWAMCVAMLASTVGHHVETSMRRRGSPKLTTMDDPL